MVYRSAAQDNSPFRRSVDGTIDVVMSGIAARGSEPETELREAWARGDGACAMRPLVEAASASPAAQAAASAIASSSSGWGGLWVARIEHFEKVRFTGLRVRPHYDLTSEGGIVSHVHASIGPLKGWLSASGKMKPNAGSAAAEVILNFDDFWIGGDAPQPRAAPSESEASLVDSLTRWVGRAAFIEGLAGFPVDYADVAQGLVAFRFPPLNSCIISRREPDGAEPQRAS